jgi:hypothetical protein
MQVALSGTEDLVPPEGGADRPVELAAGPVKEMVGSPSGP